MMFLVGLMSAVIDNIPVMVAVLQMNPQMDVQQWLLVTLTAGLVEARRVAAKAIEARNINEVEQTKVLRSVENGCRDGVYLGHDGRCADHHVGTGSELDPPGAPRGDAQSGH